MTLTRGHRTKQIQQHRNDKKACAPINSGWRFNTHTHIFKRSELSRTLSAPDTFDADSRT